MRVDEESRKELSGAAEEEVRELVASSSLAAAPILRVSAQTGDGIDALRQALAETARANLQSGCASRGSTGARALLPRIEAARESRDAGLQGAAERFAPGVEGAGTVTRVQDKGLVVDLGDDIEGFVPGSQASVDNPEELDRYYEPGDPVDLKIIEFV